MANVVSQAESNAIVAFLGYLNRNWSKLINPRDTYLIAAVSAWFHQESGGLSHVIGNNPFNIRPGMTSFMSSGVRTSSRGNGKFLIFPTIARGFEAAAYLLIHGSKAYGYQLAINALKKGGNQGAIDFLAALARSSWDEARYGTHNWQEAYDPKKNHLLRNYLAITGVQLGAPGSGSSAGSGSTGTGGGQPPPPPPRPLLPRDFNYQVVVQHYLNPYEAADLYKKRRRRSTLTQDMDGGRGKR